MKNFFGKTIGVILLVGFVISYLFGAEPQITSIWQSNQQIQPFTFSQYMTMARDTNGDTIFTNVVASIAFPGAKFGRLIHNILVQ